MRGLITAIAVLICMAAAHAGSADRLQRHEKGIWSIAGTATHDRWIVIHDLAEAARSGIYHIEVLARRKKDPRWKIERIRPHLAITAQALDRSIVAPLASGAVYPESFDDAFHRWQEERIRGSGIVCETSVLECLDNK